MKNVQTYSTKQKAFDAACTTVAQVQETQGLCILLAPTFQDCVQLKKDLASADCGFGVTVSTPSAWIADLWNEWGDSRTLISQPLRFLFIRRALRDCREDPGFTLESTAGMVGFLARIVREALPLALDPPEDETFDSQGQQVLTCIRRYADLLLEFDLIEESQACERLAWEGHLVGKTLIALDCRTTHLQDCLIDEADHIAVTVDVEVSCPPEAMPEDELSALRAYLYQPDFSQPIAATGKVRFAFPEGIYAQPRLLVQSLLSCVQRLRAQGINTPQLALSSKKPVNLFDQISERLAGERVLVRVEDGRLFKETPFGKSWLALLRFLSSGDWDASGVGFLNANLAADYCLGPFSFMGVGQAQSLDGRFRGWRGQDLDNALTDMVSFSYEDNQDFLEAVEHGCLQDALALQEQWIKKRASWPEAYRLQQLSAVKSAQCIHGLGDDLGLPLEDTLACLQDVVVGVSQEWPVDDPVAILQMGSMPKVAAAGPASYDAVFMADLTADLYPLKNDMRAEDLFLEKLGAYKPRNKNGELHRFFAEALSAASHEVTLVRCLHGVDTEELRPTALLEELIDCYRVDPQNPGEVDKATGLPPVLMPFASMLGEEAISLGLSVAEEKQPEKMVGGSFEAVLSEEDRKKVLLPKPLRCSGGVATSMQAGRIVLSPSAIESYLECPYKWFADRRLGLSTLDADFGLRAFGSFAHKVLERVHRTLCMNGLRRVTSDTLADSLQVLDQVFDDLFEEEQYRIANDALVPLTQSERFDVKRLRQQLEKCLRWEAHLLPDYAPFGAELSFGEDNPVEYAGFYLQGRLDRVDTDAFGRAVVIDYKTSVNASHAFRVKGAEEWALPRKVQAAIYAQVVRRKFGFVPVGALYMSYRRPSIAGLYDQTVLGPRDLPGINGETCGSKQFLEDLDRCEDLIATYLQRMRAGVIPQKPLDDKACTYCSVTVCSRRCC